MKSFVFLFCSFLAMQVFAQDEFRRIISEKNLSITIPHWDISVTCRQGSNGISYIDLNSNTLLQAIRKHTKLQETLNVRSQGGHSSPLRLGGLGGNCKKTVDYVTDYAIQNPTLEIKISLGESKGSFFGVTSRTLWESVRINMGDVTAQADSRILLESSR